MSTGNQNITGFPTFHDMTIKGNIELNGLINGIDVRDVITVHSDENIFGLKVFSESVSSTSNIHLTKYINGINVSDIVQDSFDATVEQLILATKMFDNPVRLLGNLIVNGTLEGIYIDREVVTLTTEQTIVGLKNFIDVLHVEGDINLDGLVGGADISTLARTRITLNGSHILTDCYFVDKVTFLKDILLADRIDGIAIDRLEDLYFSFFLNVQDDIDALNFVASSQCERIEQLQESFSLAVAELDFTEVIQSWDQPVRMFESFTTDSGQLYLLMIVHSENSDVCSDSFLYRWNTTEASFDLYDSFKTSGAVSVNTLITDDNTVHIVIASTAPQVCTENAHFYMQFVGGILSPLDTIVPMLSTGEFDLKATEDGLLVLFTGNEAESSTSIEGLPRGEDVLVLIQDFRDVIATSAEFIDIDNQTFIVFAERDSSTSRIYNAFLNNTLFNVTDPFSFFQEIPTVNPLDVCAFEHQDSIGFAIANHGVVRDGHADYNVYISIYHWSYTTNAFVLHDSIPFYRTSDIEIFSVGPSMYMAAVSQYSHVTIYNYEGTSGFQTVLQLDVSGVYSCHVSNALDGTILLALASEPQRGSAVSYILKAVFNGKAIVPSEQLCDIVLPSYHSENIHSIN
ncbi:uncharacterized protein LOC117099972 [Anneissia japonica]|uniref:uncharacterized protein LOC117099972 n=1 Tax=Anneissia japonica TaxID=1529436 RepID=UPI001425A6EE|nr:uncharacterized protein LOC117099972 [Anneissia japonica]